MADKPIDFFVGVLVQRSEMMDKEDMKEEMQETPAEEAKEESKKKDRKSSK